VKIMLGKLPNTSSIKLTITLSATLKAQIDRYAQLHSETWQQQVDAAILVPHIIAQYLAHDRAFRKSEKEVNSRFDARKADTSPVGRGGSS
jgi:hypothetical protein